MAQYKNQLTMTLQDAILSIDKRCGRSSVKLEELYEDINNIRQLLPQVVQFYEQKLIEGKYVADHLAEAKDHITKLEELLSHHVAADQIPPRPKNLLPAEAPKTQK